VFNSGISFLPACLADFNYSIEVSIIIEQETPEVALLQYRLPASFSFFLYPLPLNVDFLDSSR